MKELFSRTRITILGFSIFLSSLTNLATASDFALPFYNGSELGNTYAGWAAAATDASTAYSNPAGLITLKKPQIVAGGVGVIGNTQFRGTTTNINNPTPQPTTASGTAGGFGPLFYFSIPLTENTVFGFGENVPFGLGTNYPKDSPVRYSATRTQVVDVDLGPSLGFKINEKLSVGLGLDFQRLSITLNSMLPTSSPDSEGQNHLSGWGYGWHGGILYQMLPTTRIGFSYNSQTMFHTTGDSEVFTPTNEFRTTNQKANTALPARAQLSLYHDLTSRLAVMGTIFYTRWSIINQVLLKNTMTAMGTTTPVAIPFEYHDTLDYAIGFNFKANEKWLFRTGVQYFNTPSNNRDRGLADPVGQMILVGLGVHFQQNPQLGYDIGYAHDFFQQTTINSDTQLATAKGHSNTGSNVFGAQITWTI